MKILPINLTRTAKFEGYNNKANSSFENDKTKIDIWDKQMFGLTCCITAFPGASFIKNGFKQAVTNVDKVKYAACGAGLTLGLALMLMPLWKFLKKLNSDN